MNKQPKRKRTTQAGEEEEEEEEEEEAEEEEDAPGHLSVRGPSVEKHIASHAHAASPRPLARTHDTNTKRNRNRFPD